jgi:integrase
MFSHLARARGGVLVKELRIELMTELRKYFAGMIADGDQTAENANKNLRQLRALIGFAASEKGDKLVKPIKFTKFFPEKKLKPTMWEPDQLATITAAARATAGDVGGIAASTWWTAWWLAISGIGCRVSALMLAGRDDFKHGVLWLREEHQKQHEDQKFRLKPAAVAAIEDLLAAHDKPYLFPWPHDPGSYRETSEKTNWKTLFRHFEKRLLEPCGITLPKGVKTKMCRRSAATLATENGGSGQRLCGHKSKKTTEKHYMPPGRGIAVINDALLIPDGHCDPKEQLALFQKDEAA